VRNQVLKGDPIDLFTHAQPDVLPETGQYSDRKVSRRTRITQNKEGFMKRFAVICSLSLVCLAVFSMFSSLSNAAERVTTLKVTSFLPQTDKVNGPLEEWAKELEKRTNGRVKVDFYFASTLAPPVQQYDAVMKGIADAGYHVLGYTVGRFPLSEVLDLPQSVVNWTLTSRMNNEFYKKFRPKEFDGVKVLFLHGAGGFIFAKNKPINKLEDLKGMKMRTYGLNAKLMSLLGGTPVAMPTTELYDALSRGVVDGFTANYDVLEAQRLGEIAKYGTENRGSAWRAGWATVMNKNTFAALPKDIQTIVDQMSEEWVEKLGKMWDEMDKTGKAFGEKRGMKITALSKEEEARWAERTTPMWDDYIKRMKEKNLPGEEAVKFVQDYMKQAK
jgi:TRAP-type transport system periplasmic protein